MSPSSIPTATAPRIAAVSPAQALMHAFLAYLRSIETIEAPAAFQEAIETVLDACCLQMVCSITEQTVCVSIAVAKPSRGDA